jgi:hypothetical protein
MFIKRIQLRVQVLVLLWFEKHCTFCHQAQNSSVSGQAEMRETLSGEPTSGTVVLRLNLWQ